MVLDGNDWKQVYTENISSDENNTYYRAFTPKINGIFAIATREESETELKQLSQPAWPQPGTRITALAAQRFGVLSQSMPELLVIGILSAVVSYFYIGNVRRFA
ncbi:hypothetical protein HYS54_01060 [Candidatus Micrarchaeota archaeon]|nr:hypothetical protein [Candidatus Micrarchaeota archaeon]